MIGGEQLLVIPIVLPLVGAIVAVVLPWRPSAAVVLVVLVLTVVVDGLILREIGESGPLVYHVGGWAPPHGIVLVGDRLGGMLALVSAVVGVASALHTLATGAEVAHRRIFHPIFLLMLAALGGVFLTGDLFNLYVFMELVILTSIVLVALANRPISAETSLKYAILAAIGSTVLLFSIGLVYAGVGTLNLADAARRVRAGEAPGFWPIVGALMLFAFLLKGAVFPFHFWQPDTHSAAPSSVSAMLSGVLVKVGVYGIVRLTTLLFPDPSIVGLLAPLGAISALFGGLAAFTSTDLKRMLAYSTISNVGLIVLALGWGSLPGVIAALVHTVNHALIKGSLFLSAGYVTERLKEHGMDRIGGMARVAPGTTVVFGLGVLALAGLPPMSGYVSKLMLFQSGIAAEDPALLVGAAVASALGIGYSLRAFVLVFWGETPDWVVDRWTRAERTPLGPLAAALLVGCSLLLGLMPGPLVELVTATAAEVIEPERYIAVVLGEAR